MSCTAALLRPSHLIQSSFSGAGDWFLSSPASPAKIPSFWSRIAPVSWIYSLPPNTTDRFLLHLISPSAKILSFWTRIALVSRIHSPPPNTADRFLCCLASPSTTLCHSQEVFGDQELN